jgi:hypothetical protein
MVVEDSLAESSNLNEDSNIYSEINDALDQLRLYELITELKDLLAKNLVKYIEDEEKDSE